MKITISSGALLKAVTPLLKVISSKPTVNILSALLLEARDGKLTITASNMDATLRTTVTPDECTDGKAAIEAKIFGEMLRTLPDTPVTLESTDKTVSVKWDTGASSLPDMGADDYPVIPAIADVPALAIPSARLKDALTFIAGSLAPNELHPSMACACLDIKDGSMSVVASDQHELTVATVPVTGSAPGRALIHLSQIPPLKAMLETDDDTVTLDRDEKNAQFTCGGFTLVCRTVQEKYPNWESILPKDSTTEVRTTKDAILPVLKRVSVCAGKEHPHIALDVAAGSIKAHAQDLAFNVCCTDTLDCPGITGEGVKIGFDAHALTALVARIPGDEVVFGISACNRAMLIHGTDSDTAKAILMPKVVAA